MNNKIEKNILLDYDDFHVLEEIINGIEKYFFINNEVKKDIDLVHRIKRSDNISWYDNFVADEKKDIYDLFPSCDICGEIIGDEDCEFLFFKAKS